MLEIRFKERFDIYNGGEVAGFADARAQELVALGIAELVNLPAPVEVALPSAELNAAAQLEPTEKRKGKSGGKAGTLLVALLAVLFLASGLRAQTSAVNAQTVDGIAPGYGVTAGTGLKIMVDSGSIFCAGTFRSWLQGTLLATNNTTNYVYLNTASNCAPAVKTTAFTAADIPLAEVVTSGGVITTVTQRRGVLVVPPAGALGFTAENAANKDTDVAMAANSDTKYPSQKAAKAYADGKFAGGSSGLVVCWKTATTLGYCSSEVGSDGSCTCN